MNNSTVTESMRNIAGTWSKCDMYFSPTTKKMYSCLEILEDELCGAGEKYIKYVLSSVIELEHRWQWDIKRSATRGFYMAMENESYYFKKNGNKFHMNSGGTK